MEDEDIFDFLLAFCACLCFFMIFLELLAWSALNEIKEQTKNNLKRFEKEMEQLMAQWKEDRQND